MLDFRIRTFLMVCETMNYRKAAEKLNMSQPSITQHIHYLEDYYQTKLFIYDKKKLHKTKQAIILEKYSLSMRANESSLMKDILADSKREIRIGATKTIGNYVINEKVLSLIDNESISLTFVIDNTKNLFELLNKNKLDLLIIEGLFDKSEYSYQLFKKEKFVGLCNKNHLFSGKEINYKDLFTQNLIIREEGSGTRAILEMALLENSHSINEFKNINCISNFEYIKNIVKDEKGISFVFESVAKSDNDLSIFTLEDQNIIREFNFVYLKSTNVDNIINVFV
jgi:DNA-binding transcriptional LysR family regulator